MSTNNDRAFCLVPDCDEQPYPGDELCPTHQREDNQRERLDDDGREYADPRDYRAGLE